MTCNWPGPAAPLHARTGNNSRGGSRAKPGKLPFAITPQDRAEVSRPKSRMTQISGASLRIARPRPTSTRLAYDDRRQDCPTPASHLLEQFEGVEHCNDPPSQRDADEAPCKNQVESGGAALPSPMRCHDHLLTPLPLRPTLPASYSDARGRPLSCNCR